MERPFVLLSAAMSIDGHIDDSTDTRLLLSTADDFARVAAVRASSDAILVGANTVRRDNPRLVVPSASPKKVTLTASGDLDPAAAFFTTGDAEKLVYAPSTVAETLRLPGATVVDTGERVDLGAVLDDLGARGVRRLLVEGGEGVFTEFLTSGLADELHLVLAPFFVGDDTAPRFVRSGRFRWDAANRATLAEVRTIGNLVLHRYLLSQSTVDHHWLAAAVDLARHCPPTESAFNVGAIVVDAQGNELARGYSRESDEKVHAEEAALGKLDPADPRLAGATIYSSLEPCGQRKSRPDTCASLIMAAGIRRVVFALREPPVFVPGDGAERLVAGGVTVVEMPELGDGVRAANPGLF
jgi:riboflavin-specific deaminase-like protein